MSRLRLPLIFAFLLSLMPWASPSLAQNSPLLGLWSSTTYLSDGSVFASYWLQFSADGRMSERLITYNGQADYVGAYSFDPATGTLQYRMDDYEPKTVAPTFEIGRIYVMRVQFPDQNTMIASDDGGPMEYHRQQ